MPTPRKPSRNRQAKLDQNAVRDRLKIGLAKLSEVQ
jgi:hypothetical protein